jgi:D-alanyl-D-alanine carboxypeptidase (penicillin-binding protein 5/6)
MILVEETTGVVLAEKDPDALMAPSSMSKLMTIYVALELIRDGKLALTDSFGVSEKAWRFGGSKMFVNLNTKVTVDELLRGIIIQSGNDACIVLAEGISGSEETFAELMNKRAAAIGLKHSHFKNSTGWPDPEHKVTARDLAILAYRMIHDFPDYFKLFSERTYTYNGITQGNRNPLLYSYAGADGLKTGHTEEAGYGLTATAMRDGRRLILVINGLENVNTRARESERLLDWGFTEFKNYKLFAAGEKVDDLPVWLGSAKTVGAIVPSDIVITLPRGARAGLKVKFMAPGPAPAPVAKDAEIAKLVISAPGFGTLERPLLAQAEIGKQSSFRRIGTAFRHLFWGE